MRIYLIGFKNSGKTTTGKKLAYVFGYQFIDLDEQIEQNDGRTVPQIFTEDGEPEFRVKEQLALHQTTRFENAVISTGGGVPRFFDNMDWMLTNGTVIYLKLDEDTLFGRLKQASANRPILQGKTPEQLREYVQDLLNQHEHQYLRAQFVVDAKNLSPDDLVSRILKNYTSK